MTSNVVCWSRRQGVLGMDTTAKNVREFFASEDKFNAVYTKHSDYRIMTSVKKTQQ